eukprot:jgi/Astpho2/6375/fgenesh1_pg.00091_%23_38_t
MQDMSGAVQWGVGSQQGSSQPRSTAPLVEQQGTQTGSEAEAQCLAGDRKFFGHAEPSDLGAAFELYLAAAEQGYPPAMCRVAACYRQGQGCLTDAGLARHWYRQAVRLGVLDVVHAMGSCIKAAVLKLAARLGNLDALHAIGQLYQSGELAGARMPQSLSKAAGYFGRAASAGHLASQTSLGFLYERGLGVAQDFLTAAKWYHAAAEGGDARAQNSLAVMLAQGFPPEVPADSLGAVMWFQRSSAQGNAAAMSNLATAVEEGHGAPRNPAAALSLWQAAADLGHVPAHLHLGCCSLERGDFVQAAAHLRRAADGGEAEAELHLGRMFWQGLGHSQDLAAAERHFSAALQGGLQEAAGLLSAVQDAALHKAAPNNDFEIQQQELIQTLQQQHLQHQAIIQGLQSQLQVQATVPLQT